MFLCSHWSTPEFNPPVRLEGYSCHANQVDHPHWRRPLGVYSIRREGLWVSAPSVQGEPNAGVYVCVCVSGVCVCLCVGGGASACVCLDVGVELGGWVLGCVGWEESRVGRECRSRWSQWH